MTGCEQQVCIHWLDRPVSSEGMSYACWEKQVRVTPSAPSAADIMTVLYWHEMNIDPSRPTGQIETGWSSKGHAAGFCRCLLGGEGLFPVDDLMTLRLGSHLQGHPDSIRTLGGVPPVLWGRVCLWPTAWLWQPKWMDETIGYMPCWVMASWRKAWFRSGHDHCPLSTG